MQAQAAAKALWWTALLSALVVAAQWAFYLFAVTAQPPWFLAIWGPGADWAAVRSLWLPAIITLKMILWVQILLATGLTLWSRQLRRG
jgi:hypothetical protein